MGPTEGLIRVFPGFQLHRVFSQIACLAQDPDQDSPNTHVGSVRNTSAGRRSALALAQLLQAGHGEAIPSLRAFVSPTLQAFHVLVETIGFGRS